MMITNRDRETGFFPKTQFLGDKQNLLQDYALDLLPSAAKRKVEKQIATDPTLLLKLQQERQVGTLVKGTLRQTSQIDNGRLAQLMPSIPSKKPAPRRSIGWQRQLAMAAMLFLLLFSGWQWHNNNQPALWPTQATFVAVTATITNTPVPTETQTMPTETAVAKQTNESAIITPAPPPTPIAAVHVNTN